MILTQVNHHSSDPWTLLTVNLTDLAHHYCPCEDGSQGCIRDERGQCRRILEVLEHSGDHLRDRQRRRHRRRHRRNNRRRLRRLLRRWVREELERDHRHKL